MSDMLRRMKNRLYPAVMDAFRRMGNLDDWDIEPEAQYACLARNPRVEVRFTIDPRNDQVSSGMIFSDEHDDRKEPLYGYIVGRLFGDAFWRDPEPTDSIEEKALVEVRNVIEFLLKMRENNFSGRDIHLYFLGFNSGYGYKTAVQERCNNGQI